MYQPLAPCPGCRRHVRVSETACPFCSTAWTAELVTAPGNVTGRRLSRAAAYAFGTALAVAGCGSTVAASDASTTTSDAEATDHPISAALYGGAPPPHEDAGFMTHYGAPVAVDAGGVDVVGAGPPDEGSVYALYGDPGPPPDAH